MKTVLLCVLLATVLAVGLEHLSEQLALKETARVKSMLRVMIREECGSQDCETYTQKA